MRVSRAQAADNRKRVVDTAGQLFRERGYDGIGVADLMKAAGLTHGGFYGQFQSREALVAEALEVALEASVGRWNRRVARNPEAPMSALVDFYLSSEHRDARGIGCPVAALASDTARQGEAIRQTYGKGVEALVDILADTMPEETPEARRQSALVAFSAMVGALMLSRAVGNEVLSAEILEAARAAFARNG